MRREANLYVDYDWIGQRFASPSEQSRRYAFEDRWSELTRTQEALDRIRRTAADGLFTITVLSTLNDVFAPTYINDSTETRAIEALHTTFAERVGRTVEQLRATSFWAWPLYHFSTAKAT